MNMAGDFIPAQPDQFTTSRHNYITSEMVFKCQHSLLTTNYLYYLLKGSAQVELYSINKWGCVLGLSVIKWGLPVC